MKTNTKQRLQLFMQNSMFVALFVALVVMLGFVSRQYHKSTDITQSTRNTLTQGSVNLLKTMDGPINITAFVTKDDGNAYHKSIEDFISRYQRSKHDISVKFINPAEEPKIAQDLGIRSEGELVIEYKKRSEHLIPAYVEQDMTNLLVRLARTQRSVIMFLDGHGERSLSGKKNHDLGEFGNQLVRNGFKISNIDLTIAPNVPANGSMLVIAAPQVNLADIEIKKIQNYVESGGNILWLVDQEPLHGLEPVADYIGLDLSPGIVVDPSSQQNGGDPKIVFVNQYGDHAITKNFQYLTLFPEARKVELKHNEQTWDVTKLISVAQNGWLERGKLDGKYNFDEKVDEPGPINIALALERKSEKVNQRIVIIGDGNFLSNQFITNASNNDLGLNIVNWLAGDDRLITIQPKPLKDANVVIGSKPMNILMAWLIFRGFQYILPFALLVTGILIWLKRRKG